MGEAVRGRGGRGCGILWGRCGRLPISASITRAARPATCAPDVKREEGSCQMHTTCERGTHSTQNTEHRTQHKAQSRSSLWQSAAAKYPLRPSLGNWSLMGGVKLNTIPQDRNPALILLSHFISPKQFLSNNQQFLSNNQQFLSNNQQFPLLWPAAKVAEVERALSSALYFPPISLLSINVSNSTNLLFFSWFHIIAMETSPYLNVVIHPSCLRCKWFLDDHRCW